jgi:predicted ABC-type ATPase
MRVVAGPNGSGKSTLVDYLRSSFSLPLGRYQNPDALERQLATTGSVDLAHWGIRTDEAALRAFVAAHPLGTGVAAGAVGVQGDVLSVTAGLSGGYLTTVLCDFMRRQWLEAGASFTFETVMSGADKVALIADARRRGYRTYLYYVCTDSPLINRERVAARVAQGGHDVPPGKIEPRYHRSLALAPGAIRLCDRAFLFDNSDASHAFVAEYANGQLVRVAAHTPAWFAASIAGVSP